MRSSVPIRLLPATPLTEATPLNRIPLSRKDTPVDSDSEDDFNMGEDTIKVPVVEKEDVEVKDSINEFHNGKQGCQLIVYNIGRVFNCGGPKEGLFRANVADNDIFTMNVFFYKQVADKVDKDFKQEKAYLVNFTKTTDFKSAKHVIGITDWTIIKEVDFSDEELEEIDKEFLLSLRAGGEGKKQRFTVSTPSKLVNRFM